MLLSIVSEWLPSQSLGKGEVENWIGSETAVPKILVCSKHGQVVAGSPREPAVLCCAPS